MVSPSRTNRKLARRLAGVLLFLLALGAGALYLFYLAIHKLIDPRVVTPPGIVKEIQQLKELVTVKYSIQKVVGLKEEKIPFGTESLLMIVQAKVLGGIDLADMREQDVVVGRNKSVTIKLPAPKVMHIYLDEKETKVWDRSKTWWTPWVPFNPDLERKARLTAIESVQADALSMGILKDARRNAETTIREMLRAFGVESVTFVGGSVTRRKRLPVVPARLDRITMISVRGGQRELDRPPLPPARGQSHVEHLGVRRVPF